MIFLNFQVNSHPLTYEASQKSAHGTAESHSSRHGRLGCCARARISEIRHGFRTQGALLATAVPEIEIVGRIQCFLFAR